MENQGYLTQEDEESLSRQKWLIKEKCSKLSRRGGGLDALRSARKEFAETELECTFPDWKNNK